MENKQQTKPELLKDMAEMIANADEKQIYVMYGTLVGVCAMGK